MKKALVLCGGGSLGSYEVGVWKYLRERGQRFDIVTGTSIGAINGAMYCCDKFDECEKLWKNVATDSIMNNGLNFYEGFLKNFNKKKKDALVAFALSYVKNGGADITPLTELVKNAIDPQLIMNSPTQLGIVTTAYPSMKEIDIVAREVGPDHILDYLHASSASWPFFPIYKMGNQKFIDGGYNNNLPIDFAIRLGATEIVAVVLHAIPKNPQHPELMSLPFVNTVRPFHDLGTIFDFYGKVTSENMELGYLDALKTFGEAWGKCYTFYKDEKYVYTSEGIIYNVIKEHPYDYLKIKAALQYDGTSPNTARHMLTRALEMIAEWLGVPYAEQYSLDDFQKLIVDKVRALAIDPAVSAQANGEKRRDFHLKEKDRKPFLAYLYLFTLYDFKDTMLEKFYEKNPETAVFKEIFKYWKGLGLITKLK